MSQLQESRSALAGLRGVVPPCITFFDERGSIDEPRLRRHVDWLIEAQVNGLLVGGTCGAQEGTVAGIKDSHGDPARITSLQMLCPPDTAILYGEDYGGLEAILAGADGWTAGVANFMPRHAVELWRLACSGDLTAARRHWLRMLPLVNMASHKVMFGRPDERPDFIQIYKAALDVMDLAGGRCRRPLLALPNADLAVLHDLASELMLTPASA